MASTQSQRRSFARACSLLKALLRHSTVEADVKACCAREATVRRCARLNLNSALECWCVLFSSVYACRTASELKCLPRPKPVSQPCTWSACFLKFCTLSPLSPVRCQMLVPQIAIGTQARRKIVSNSSGEAPPLMIGCGNS